MKINEKTLSELEKRDTFLRVFSNYAMTATDSARLFPKLSKPRIYEAHGAWLMDLDRVGTHERHLTKGLDHFKRCGHLTFWLRRMSPIVEFMDLNFEELEHPMTDLEKAFHKLLISYSNEYLAFDFGFQICKYYETKHKKKPSKRAAELVLSQEYYQTTCHFLKYKTASPHALQLIFKSLFYYNGIGDDIAPKPLTRS
jgi:hypothetical protein